MILTELDLPLVKSYLRVDHDNDDVLIVAILEAAVQYAESYTGLSTLELCEYPDVTIAVLALTADMYDLRQFTVPNTNVNPTAQQILSSHCANFL